jgi:hypothetical protein
MCSRVAITLYNHYAIVYIGRRVLTTQNYSEIKARFASLILKVNRALQSRQISVTVVCDFLTSSYNKDSNWIQNPSSFIDVFTSMFSAELWSYDHYGPLEELTKIFLSDDAAIKERISEYKSDLTGFYVLIKIADFIDPSEFYSLDSDNKQGTQESLPVDLNTRRQLKMLLCIEREISARALYYVDNVWKSSAEVIYIPSLTAVIKKIEAG